MSIIRNIKIEHICDGCNKKRPSKFLHKCIKCGKEFCFDCRFQICKYQKVKNVKYSEKIKTINYVCKTCFEGFLENV